VSASFAETSSATRGAVIPQRITATEASSIIERIKQKLDIVEEIGAVVSLKKSGKAFKGLCPFHGERTPSFYVFPDKQDWHCFGCGERGDIITFVQKQQSLDFREALELLAERAGIPLERGGHPESAEDHGTAALFSRVVELDSFNSDRRNGVEVGAKDS